jgi:hypothetical protein
MSVIPSNDTGFILGLLIVVFCAVMFVFCVVLVGVCFVCLTAYKLAEFFWYELRRTIPILGSPGETLWMLLMNTLGFGRPSSSAADSADETAVELKPLQSQ